MSHSMMLTSMLGREELRIFEELISRFDSLSEAQRSAAGVTPEWSAKDLLAHLAYYWERAAAEEVREFEAGRWPPEKQTRAQMERISREVVSANRATPRHLLRLLSLRAAQGASPGTTSHLGCTFWQDIVNEKESPPDEVRFNATATFVETGNKKGEACRYCAPERVSTQLDSADAGPRSSNQSPYHSLPDALGGCFWFISRFLPNMDFSSSPFKRNFVHSQFH